MVHQVMKARFVELCFIILLLSCSNAADKKVNSDILTWSDYNICEWTDYTISNFNVVICDI